jgi:predicted Zn-dependent protease
MDTHRRRTPLRILAPVALIAFGVALALVITSANKSDSGSGTSASKAEKARDLGTSTSRERSRRRAARDRLPKRIYVVQTGDTLGSIAEKTGVSVEKLQALNPGLDQFSLQTGQKIKIR